MSRSLTLEFLTAGIVSVNATQPNRFTRALDVLRRIVDSVGFPVAIVGGLAGIRHGTNVTTLDIDIVLPSGKADEFARAAIEHGFNWTNRSIAGWHRLEFPDPDGVVLIECLPAGQNSPRDPEDAPPIPEPSDLGVVSGLGYADLPGWVLMKLVANRDKDRYHLGEAIKHFDESAVASVVQKLRNQPARYLSEFQRLLQNSLDEDSTNW